MKRPKEDLSGELKEDREVYYHTSTIKFRPLPGGPFIVGNL